MSQRTVPGWAVRQRLGSMLSRGHKTTQTLKTVWGTLRHSWPMIFILLHLPWAPARSSHLTSVSPRCGRLPQMAPLEQGGQSLTRRYGGEEGTTSESSLSVAKTIPPDGALQNNARARKFVCMAWRTHQPTWHLKSVDESRCSRIAAAKAGPKSPRTMIS